MVDPKDGPSIFAALVKAMDKHPQFFAGKPSHENDIQYLARKADEGDQTALAIADEFKKAGLL